VYEVLQLPWLGEPPVAVIFNLSFYLFDLLSMTKQTLLFDVAQGAHWPHPSGERMSKFRQKWPDFGRFPERPEGRGLMDNPSEALNIIGYGGGEKIPCS